MKKTISIVLLLTLLITTISLSACNNTGNPNSNQGNQESVTKEYRVGLNTWGTSPILQLYGNEAAFAIETIGMRYERVSDDNDAGIEIQNVQNLIDSGVDGLCLQGAGENNLSKISRATIDAKIPFVLYIFTGTEEGRKDLTDNNPYYAGAVASDLKADGRVLAEKALADGAKTACLIGGNEGDHNMDVRSEGFREAFEKSGGTILAEARCVDSTETEEKAMAMLSEYPDVDAIYIMTGDFVEGTFIVLDELGITEAKSYLSSVNASSVDHIKSGRIEAGSAGNFLGANIAPTLLQNMLDGHPIKDDNGKPPYFEIPTSLVTKDNVDAFNEVFHNADRNALSPEVIKSLSYRFNNKVDYKTYIDVIANDLSLDAIIAAAGY